MFPERALRFQRHHRVARRLMAMLPLPPPLGSRSRWLGRRTGFPRPSILRVRSPEPEQQLLTLGCATPPPPQPLSSDAPRRRGRSCSPWMCLATRAAFLPTAAHQHAIDGCWIKARTIDGSCYSILLLAVPHANATHADALLLRSRRTACGCDPCSYYALHADSI